MSRPMLLVFLLMVLIITSQFEWRQQLVGDMDTTDPKETRKQLPISKREDVVKEKSLQEAKSLQSLIIPPAPPDGSMHQHCKS